MKLSKNLSLSEMTKSVTALRRGIDNSPTKEHIHNMEVLAQKIFQPIRDYFGVPIHISSGYRSEALNKAIGGAHRYIDGKYVPTSQHCKGQAIDLDRDGHPQPNNSDLFYYIKDKLEFDQLIWEFGTDKNPSWVHVSYNNLGTQRKQILVAYKDKNGRTKYKKYEG
jgi:hypothetical protein